MQFFSSLRKKWLSVFLINHYVTFLLFLVVFFFNRPVNAEPWFTGSLLSIAGHTLPRGHTSLELYGFTTQINSVYGPHGKTVHITPRESYVLNTIFAHGLSNEMDLQFNLPYVYNQSFHGNINRIGDAMVVLGYQLFEQKKALYRPDLRITVQEIIPTGRYQHLAPLSNGIDATGSGSYQTAISFNFQHLAELYDNHFLRTRLNLFYLYSSSVFLTGLNCYGGTANTYGRIWPGSVKILDLAAELTLTQNWVAVMEGFLAHRQKTYFRGYAGFYENGEPALIGHNEINELSLAPAIEYNFSPNFGIIGGSWFSIRGKNTVRFVSYVIAFNFYW